MKFTPSFGMIFRFSNPITRADAAAMLRMVRSQTKPLVAEPHTYFFNGFILHTR